MTHSVVTPLPWDSEFFGLPIARAEIVAGGVGEAVATAARQGVECLYLVIEGAETTALDEAQRLGGRLVDLRVELDLAGAMRMPGGIRRADEGDLEALIPSVRELATVSRFWADPRFAREAVERMYEIWLAKCLEEGFIVVGEPSYAGFVGARPKGETLSLDLVFVDSSSRSEGLATRLVQGAVASSGQRHARVATQAANVAAQRAFQRVGFRTSSIHAVVHLWL